MTDCSPPQQNWTHPRFDDFHQIDDLRIATYAGRRNLNPPYANCPTTFPVNPTIRIQSSGNSWPTKQWRTDVESDLRGINYLSTRIRAEEPCINNKIHYNPEVNTFNTMELEHAPDESFPMNFNYFLSLIFCFIF